MTIPETQGAADNFMDSVTGRHRHDGPRGARADQTEKQRDQQRDDPTPKEDQ
jgi:hypothetical protein